MTFNPKVFTKNRIYRKIKQYPGQSKLFIWDKLKLQYGPPPRGKNILACRTVLIDGKKLIRKEFFNSSDEAHLWQISNEMPTNLPTLKKLPPALDTFAFVLERWKAFHYTRVKDGTRIRYEGLIKRAFSYWRDHSFWEITPVDVDNWLIWLKAQPGRPTRKSFDDELDLLKVIMNYFEEFDDSNKFKSPIKDRHYQTSLVRKERKSNRKITEEEFLLFRDQIKLGCNGTILFYLVTVQFYQALRVSEVCALSWADVHFASKPEESYIEISKHISWKREKGAKPEVTEGFKNSQALGGSKKLYLHPQSFASLAKMKTLRGAEELVFTVAMLPFTYRQLQHAYNEALTTLGLPFRSTHILRHGGSTHYMNLYPDYALNQMILGNTTLDSTKVYAQRSASAMKEMNAKVWAQVGSVAAISCNSEKTPENQLIKEEL